MEPGEEVLHSSSVDKERTRLREEGVMGSSETDSLKILGLVSSRIDDLYQITLCTYYVDDLYPITYLDISLVTLMTITNSDVQFPHSLLSRYILILPSYMRLDALQLMSHQLTKTPSSFMWTKLPAVVTW